MCYPGSKPNRPLVRRVLARAKALGLPQGKLAVRLKVGENSIYNWKIGKPMAPEAAAKLKRFLAGKKRAA